MKKKNRVALIFILILISCAPSKVEMKDVIGCYSLDAQEIVFLTNGGSALFFNGLKAGYNLQSTNDIPIIQFESDLVFSRGARDRIQITKKESGKLFVQLQNTGSGYRFIVPLRGAELDFITLERSNYNGCKF